ncbi:hypothetical protein K443DRAFT_122076 [Laccaria amethystina LaAM-08-1]|uniref:Uncharacterized protein n=1 Tax=Laccaria amethystina LaAM-08-1 TaxID=1095629 RepID=A0A0C9XWT7_9AGAR|nr:hypothetical protein K443DRAFT_122076 [Laccaria amethystina LaAM-08-1]
MSGDVTMATIMSPSTALDNPTAGNTSMPVAPALASVLDATIITMVTADTASVTSDPPQSMEPHMQDPPDAGYEDQEMEDVAPLPVQSDGAMKCKRATDAGDAPLDAAVALAQTVNAQNYILTAIGQVVPQQQQQQEDIPGLLARARDKQQVMEEEDGI